MGSRSHNYFFFGYNNDYRYKFTILLLDKYYSQYYGEGIPIFIVQI